MIPCCLSIPCTWERRSGSLQPRDRGTSPERLLLDSLQGCLSGVDVLLGLLQGLGELQEGLPDRLAAFRIVEEALGNVMRHGQATTAHITLGLDGHSSLVITVGDNGCGFDVDRVRPGLGLASIESRVRQAGGHWHITSVPTKGTKVSVCLPLPPTST